MSSLGCNLDSLFPSANNFLESMESLGKMIGELLNDIYGKVTTSFGQFSLESLSAQTRQIQRQILNILPLGNGTFNSRFSIRSMLGLSNVFDDDPKAIEKLSGSVKRVAKRKTNVTRLIRYMRDYDGY